MRDIAKLLSLSEYENRNLRQILALETMPATFFHNFFFGRIFGLPGASKPWEAKKSADKKAVENSC